MVSFIPTELCISIKDLLNSIMAYLFRFCLPETLEELS